MGGYGGMFSNWVTRCMENNTIMPPYNSCGNGSAMRVSPVGWFFNTEQEVLEAAKRSAECTHNHPEGIKGAQATASAIWLARNGKSKEEIRNYIETSYGYDLHKTWEDWHYAYYWQDSCQGTVPQALIAFLDAEDFVDAIRKAVSMGGDSDTLACITGGVAEAFYGGVPEFIASRVTHNLPKVFYQILDGMRAETAYGKLKAVQP